jgi:hypothetical protein
MKVKVVIFNHNQRDTAEKLYSSLGECFDVALLDSGSSPEQISPISTFKFENLYWTGCWNKSWELFSDYDIIWGIGGDCVLLSDPVQFADAITSSIPFGIWSPAIVEHAVPHMKLSESKVLSVKFLEGVAFALSKSLWCEVGQFDPKNYLGWGHDAIRSHFSRKLGMRNILDGRVQLQHPAGARYDQQTAEFLMRVAMRRALGDDFNAFMISLHQSRTVALNTIEELTLC